MKKLIGFAVAVTLVLCAFCPIVLADGVNYGDLDSSGTVNSFDALLVLQHTTDIKLLPEDSHEAADVSDDGAITAGDALSILQFSAGLIDSFPAQEKKVPATMQEILDCYKEIAADNSDVVTSQSFDLVKIDIGSKLLNPAFKTLAKMVLDSNTVEVPGFPGDVENITVDDLTAANYVANNDGTVTVTLNIKPQTDNLEGSKYEGPVGRTIGVVGNLPQVVVNTGVNEFVNIDNATGELAYEDAFVTVTVDENNKLVKDKCLWQYTVIGDIKGFDISYSSLGINIKNGAATGEIDYKLEY